MNIKAKIKVIFNSSKTKISLIVLAIILLIFAVFLPSIIMIFTIPAGAITAYNRDATSGTREAFAKKVILDPEFTPGKNVREVSNNDSMIRAVEKNPNSIGYVSLNTVATLPPSDNFSDSAIIIDKYKNKIGYAYFLNEPDNQIIAPSRDTIKNGKYAPTREFNMFFRVENESEEAEILDYDFNGDSNDNIINLNDDLKASYLFLNWVLYSTESYELMEKTGEIPSINEDSLWSDTSDIVKNYIQDVNLISNDWTIEIVGSTSASNIVYDLSKKFIDFIHVIDPEISINFIMSTNGSGDAFNNNVPGTKNPYIGIQSRDGKDEEFEKWGWYDDDEKSSVYNSFALDAILIIYNLNNRDKNPSIDISSLVYTTSERMRKIYIENEYLIYDDIFLEVVPDA